MSSINNNNRLKAGNIIILQSLATGKSVRMLSDTEVDANGATGKYARFRVLNQAPKKKLVEGSKVEQLSQPSIFRLQNALETTRFLRIDGSNNVSVGKGGGWCNFTAVPHPEYGHDVFSLRSASMKRVNQSLHVAFHFDGTPKPANQPSTGPQLLFRVRVIPEKSILSKKVHVSALKSDASSDGLECWVSCKQGKVPARAVRGGHEKDGRPLYILWWQRSGVIILRSLMFT
eukprot:TRINITY_DN1180_c1_g2_i2.p1 TRINITY_DN1180_c1_g2~~TRINITY_DN1180_c1_g2_i2.p1  ORF type:complete len:250 (+),score=33.21 TRINITY_DN1180_c1_g2_i2:60-752(+)